MAKAPKKKTAIQRKTKVKKASVTEATLFEHLQLKNIRLVDLVSHLVIREGKIPVFAAIESAATVGPSPDGKLLVDMTLDLTGKPKDVGDDSSSLKINVHYQCIYDVVDAEPKQFEPFAADVAKVGMLILWPHIRELVQSVTSRMSIPAFILPVFSPSKHVAEVTASKAE